MKYVRVIDDSGKEYITTYQKHCEMVVEQQDFGFDFEGCIVGESDNIEELCDELVAVDRGILDERIKCYKTVKEAKEDKTFLYDSLYGAIRVENELIKVAEFNNEKWELL